MSSHTTAPLTSAQTGIYAECIGRQGTPCYNIPYLYILGGELDTDRLCRSIETALKAHPTLFTRLTTDDQGAPVQYLDLPSTFSISAEAVPADFHEWVEPFNIMEDRLFHIRLAKDDKHHYLLWDAHHLVNDGTSMQILLHDIEAAYQGSAIETETCTLADIAHEEAALRQTPAFEADRQWYAQTFDCEELTSALLPDKQSGVEAFLERTLDISLADIEAFCQQHGIYKSTLMTTAYAFLLARYNNEQAALMRTVYNGRSDRRLQHSMGMFVKTLPVYCRFTDDTTVLELLQQQQEQMRGCRQHSNYAFADLMSEHAFSIDTTFVWHGELFNDTTLMGYPLQTVMLTNDKEGDRLYVKAYTLNGRICVRLEYDGCYSEALVSQFADCYEHVLQAMFTTERLADIELIDERQAEALDAFNQTDVPYDDSQTVVSLFRRQAALTPDKVAVVYHDRQYTYREVDELSDRIAAFVSAKGLKAEDVVSILIPRCEWMVIASLGVLKAGCAYQPLDPSYPAERLNFMMQDAKARLLIADETLRPLVNEYQGDVLLTSQLPRSSGKPMSTSPSDISPQPSDLFILLYTSGSTGIPKGCQLEHRNIVAFCHWYQRYYQLTPESHVAAYASFGFDACMMDIYPAITCGACVYIIGDDIRLNLPDLNIYFNQNNITHSFITTQVGYQFATNVDNHSLQCLSVGGEKLSALQPPKNYRLFNGYGPTECTIFTTTYEVNTYEQDIPIGKPLDNLKLYIVDKQGHRLPIGATGELWISGPQVSRGYLNQPEKTAETYIDTPWGRCYRTGDIVRYLPDGNIQFVGRKDRQVKIRGFRIELKEVEAAIRQYPDIKDVTVQAFDYDNGGKYIAAYVVSDIQIDIKALHEFIGRHKPSYMIPAATMQIDAIPLNQNQKVNRKLLPQPTMTATERNYTAPTNDMERFFCRIFSEILYPESQSGTSPHDTNRIGTDDDFFALGGTSLMVTRVIIEADKAGYHLAYGDIFSHATPRLLAAYLSKDAEQADSPNANEDSQYDYTPIDTLLHHNTLDAFRQGERQQLGRVLLTGSTGYLGIHVLRELIDREEVPAIWCMVRANDADKAERRLKGLLFYYFGKNYKELFGHRLHVVVGDVTNMNSFPTAMPVDTVVNCAAVVKHFSNGTEIEDVNIGGAFNCIRYCLQTGARLIHVSTYSTAGLSVNGKPAPGTIQTEQTLYYGQYMDNRYVHSKFIAERTVLEAIAVHGLNGKVMRVGNLAPRSTDGEFQINIETNAAMGRLRLYKVLGCYPYEQTDQPMEFSPINEVARAIITLAKTPRECCLFHPFNNHSVHFGDVLAQFHVLGEEPCQVESDEFYKVLEETKASPAKARYLQSLVAYQDMAHGQQATPIGTSNTYTTQVLYRLGFRWSTTSWDYVYRFLAAIDGLGYFEQPTT